MFGIDKDAIKKSFQDYDQKLAELPPPQDPHVQAILEFIEQLEKAFN